MEESSNKQKIAITDRRHVRNPPIEDSKPVSVPAGNNVKSMEFTNKQVTPTSSSFDAINDAKKAKKNLLKPVFSRLASKKKIIAIGLATLVIVFCVVDLVFGGKPKPSEQHPPLLSNVKKPNFEPLVPIGEEQLAHLSLKQAFSGAHDSYTFNDLFLGVPIQVSEQPMPSTSLSYIAKKLDAFETVNFKGGVAYLATNTTTKKQELVLSKDGLLIFIQGSDEISQTAWPDYINNLSPA